MKDSTIIENVSADIFKIYDFFLDDNNFEEPIVSKSKSSVIEQPQSDNTSDVLSDLIANSFINENNNDVLGLYQKKPLNTLTIREVLNNNIVNKNQLTPSQEKKREEEEKEINRNKKETQKK